MKIAAMILAVLIGLLSIAAGAAKITLVPEEAEFLSQFGFNDLLTIVFGIVQAIGGIVLLIPATRLYGAVIAGIAFTVSLGMILITGNLAFAAVSFVPVALSALIIYLSLNLPKDVATP